MRKLLLTTTAIVLACSAAAPALADFKARNIRVSNGINADHPVGNGIKAMQACLDGKFGDMMNQKLDAPRDLSHLTITE